LIKGHTPKRRAATRILPPAVVQAALAGLEDGVTKHYGTGSRIRYAPGDTDPILTTPNVRVRAKTGTAQAPPWVRDIDGDGVIAPGERVAKLDHAWYVGLVGPPGEAMPTYAISVLVEYGGSGGRGAGPIANAVIGAMQEQGFFATDTAPVGVGQ
jgi:penicillin-binding protein 2